MLKGILLEHILARKLTETSFRCNDLVALCQIIRLTRSLINSPQENEFTGSEVNQISFLSPQFLPFHSSNLQISPQNR
jgi:hypothetical protein